MTAAYPTKQEQEEFVIGLANSAKSYDQWLAIIRFGLPTLLQDSEFLVELMTMQAQKLIAEPNHPSGRKLSDEMAKIMRDLGLKFEN